MTGNNCSSDGGLKEPTEYRHPTVKEQIKEHLAYDAKKDERGAKWLHEAGREAVLNNKVLKKDGNPLGKIVFKEWDDLPEEAKEGRRIQARFLRKHRVCF